MEGAQDDVLQDFLLDMDFDELIPVDNFFDSYVGALSKDGRLASVNYSIACAFVCTQVCARNYMINMACRRPGEGAAAELSGHGTRATALVLCG
jgi:hypothetical protein